jgi:hypothetical protein
MCNIPVPKEIDEEDPLVRNQLNASEVHNQSPQRHQGNKEETKYS